MNKRLIQDLIDDIVSDLPKNIDYLIDKKIDKTVIRSNIVVPNKEIEITYELKEKINFIMNNNRLTKNEKFNVVQNIINNTNMFKNKNDDYIINSLMQNKDFNSFAINSMGIKNNNFNNYVNENEKSWYSFFNRLIGKSLLGKLKSLFCVYCMMLMYEAVVDARDIDFKEAQDFNAGKLRRRYEYKLGV